MNKIIEILEDNGLVSEELITKFVYHNPAKSVLTVRDALSAALDDEFQPVADGLVPESPSPFNFAASASIRGDSGCNRWECHLEKVGVLARYSALYCDRVFVPLSLGEHSSKRVEDHLYSFVRGAASILQLRQLIEAGIVILQPEILLVCRDCLPGEVPSYSAVKKAAFGLLEDNRRKFTLLYDRRDPKAVEIRGPSAYIEHGQMVMHLNKRYSWLPNPKKNGPVKLAQAVVDKSGILEDLFGELEQDVVMQQFYGLKCGASYLTDRSGEAELLEKLAHEEELEVRAAALCRRLTHSVPLLAELPLPLVIRLRGEEPEAFVQYRSAVSQIVTKYVREGKDIGKKEAKEIFSDILEPQVLNLQARAKALRDSSLKRALVKTAATSAVLALGVLGGLIPSQVLELFKAIGGLKLVADLGETYAAIEKNPAEIRSHNLYFLLRLKQESGM